MRHSIKKTMALLTAVIIAAGMIAGCGKGPDGATGTAGPSNTPAAANTSGEANEPGAVSQPQEEAKGEDLSAQPPVTLNVVSFATMNYEQGSIDRITKALNEYIKPLINAEVTLDLINPGSYYEKISLLMAGTEHVDLITGIPALVAALYRQGALLPMDDAIAKYGQGIRGVLGDEMLAAGKVDGQIYSVPPERGTMAVSYGYLYRKDMNEQYGLGLEKAKNWDDIEASLAILRQKAPDIIGVWGDSSTSMFNSWGWDKLDSNYGVLMNGGAELKVENLYATQEYKELVGRMHRWYQAGYVYSEATTSTVPFVQQFLSGNLLGHINVVTPIIEAQYKRLYGIDIGYIELTKPYISTSSVTGATWSVPHNTVSADRAVQFLELLYTDKTVFNLVTLGEEGIDYKFVDKEKEIVDYADGVTAGSKKYEGAVYLWGNRKLGYIWNGDPLTMYQDLDKYNDEAFVSKALGFTLNNSSYQNESTACYNVDMRYTKGLECGALDPATALPEFIAELEAAGINTIISEKQSQLDAWAAANAAR